METGFASRDILVHRTLYGDWEVMNASVFFSKTEETAEPQHKIVLSPNWGFNTFEDCKALLVQVASPNIKIVEI